MKRLFATLGLVAAFAALAGCYYDPGYSYVRSSGYGGDAYYGQGYVEPTYSAGYYDDYYGGGYYDDRAPGVSIGISTGWYGSGGRGYYRGRHGYRDNDRGGYRGRWEGNRGGDRDRHGDRDDGNHGRGDRDHRDGGGRENRPASSWNRGHHAPSSSDQQRERGRDHRR